MAGQRLLAVALIIAAAPALFAQEPASRPGKREKARQQEQMSPEFEDVRKALEALTPEQRKRFQQNFLRWSDLPPETKKALRDRDEFRKKKMADEIEAALQQSGLTLDKERRRQFTKRYVQERRKIEEQLRAETEEKRGPLVAKMVAGLKEEFATPAEQP